MKRGTKGRKGPKGLYEGQAGSNRDHDECLQETTACGRRVKIRSGNCRSSSVTLIDQSHQRRILALVLIRHREFAVRWASGLVHPTSPYLSHFTEMYSTTPPRKLKRTASTLTPGATAYAKRLRTTSGMLARTASMDGLLSASTSRSATPAPAAPAYYGKPSEAPRLLAGPDEAGLALVSYPQPRDSES